MVTNMSLSAIDAVLNKVPIITHTSNVAAPIASHDLKFIEKPLRPGRKTMDEWLKFVADNQFTIKEWWCPHTDVGIKTFFNLL